MNRSVVVIALLAALSVTPLVGWGEPKDDLVKVFTETKAKAEAGGRFLESHLFASLLNCVGHIDRLDETDEVKVDALSSSR